MSSERLPADEAYTHEKQQAVNFLVFCAEQNISRRYGPRGETPKAYHNNDHTALVMRSAQKLALLAYHHNQITIDDMPLLHLAAAFHDVVHTDEYDNEVRSAEEAAAAMRKTKVFTEKEIAAVAEAIMATRVRVMNDTRIIQAPDGKNLLPYLLADADLSSFGLPWPTFYESNTAYFKETHPGQDLEDPDVLIKFLQRQKRVIENHQYFTEEARQLFKHKGENIDQLTHLLSQASLL